MSRKRETESEAGSASTSGKSSKKFKKTEELKDEVEKPLHSSKRRDTADEPTGRFVGEPVPHQEARERWPHRYQGKEKKQFVGSNANNNVDEEIIQARRHYTQAIDDCIHYKLNDDAHVKAEEGKLNYICKIVEMFEAVDGSLHFTAQWYYRAEDTVIKNLGYLIDPKRVFFSEIRDDNPLDCLVEKLNIARVPLNLDLDAKKKLIPPCDYYCDMLYLLPYSTFVNLPSESRETASETSSTISSEVDVKGRSEHNSMLEEVSCVEEHKSQEVKLLDLYSGCGAMSTGLCLGGILSGLNLVTKWAVDLNTYACQCLKMNHPETEVRNEMAENFLSLLKEWEKLCNYFSLIKSNVPQQYDNLFKGAEDDDDDDSDTEENESDTEDGEVFVVSKVLAICYGDPNNKKEQGLYFKVSWKGYGPDEDTWEPVEGLSNCKKTIMEFIVEGFNKKILPLPGDVDVICGGPPCQGISGFNRFRNKESPLSDEKNKQLVVYMDIVEYLKPKFVLMENVVDLVRFSDGFLGRYALGRLLQMNYQSRMGIMAAGAYGLPQFRLRVFLWGARPFEKLPQFPLPTHDVVVRGNVPVEFETSLVGHEAGEDVQLQKKLLLEDAISDLPPVENDESRDEIPYSKPPQTEFQRFITLSRSEMLGIPENSKSTKKMIYDHRPLRLNEDDYQRVCQIPRKKGANFRDLPGVRVGADNKVEWDPDVERVYLESGKPLVPDYAMTFIRGTSSKPFARLWWDETIPTVVTRAEPHNQAILHPEQDRVLTVRENARLQGFPDYYKLCGPVKERYIQVGNAVAVPVARALGFSLGRAFQGSADDDPLFKLPEKYPKMREYATSESSEDHV
ncbi:hypothetical protein QN277_012498 [Acacia crassicarpa]|uniref:Cytosine-specific methyltransferase n=1 Tax=Acacia crassicarpa TaxID=499986 RepID=A0AAE1N1C0_9FABA|nr:hypothetical protein QN277_012498 [Acacia crassicarpa]